MKKFTYSALVLTLALIVLPNGAVAATKTLDNLQAAIQRRKQCPRALPRVRRKSRPGRVR